MSSSKVFEDESLISKFDRGLLRIETGFALLGGILILSVLAFSFVNIVGRGLFNAPLRSYFDMAGLSVPLIAFLALSYCQRDGSHIRMDMFIGKLKGRSLWASEILGILLTLMVILLVGYGAYFDAARDFALGERTEDTRIFFWPFKFTLLAMMALMSLRLLLQLWGYSRLLIRGGHPVAVPLMQTAEAQAAAEAQTLNNDTAGA